MLIGSVKGSPDEVGIVVDTGIDIGIGIGIGIGATGTEVSGRVAAVGVGVGRVVVEDDDVEGRGIEE